MYGLFTRSESTARPQSTNVAQDPLSEENFESFWLRHGHWETGRCYWNIHGYKERSGVSSLAYFCLFRYSNSPVDLASAACHFPFYISNGHIILNKVAVLFRLYVSFTGKSTEQTLGE